MPRKDNWEKEFDDKFGCAFNTFEFKGKDFIAQISIDSLKDFIRSLLKSERERVIGKIKKALQQEFDINFIKIKGKKYVDGQQVQDQVIKVFETLKEKD